MSELLPLNCAAASEWIADANGCKVWNSDPQSDESITWTGPCKDGYADGPGRLTWFERQEPGLVVDGDYRRGRAEGHVDMHFADGSRYLGEAVFDKMNGHGIYTDAHGGVIDAYFVNDKPCGKGRAYWSNGDVYTGDYLDGDRTGKGVLVTANGSRYEGDFIKGAGTGKGIIVWPDGTRYEGDFANGTATGQGMITFTNGRQRKGEFIDGHLLSAQSLAWTINLFERMSVQLKSTPLTDRSEPTPLGVLEGSTDAEGHVTSWRIAHTCGWAEFDQRVLQAVNDLRDVPPFPDTRRPAELAYSYRR